MKNLIGLAGLTRLEARSEQGACVAKVSSQLSDQVKQALEARWQGVRLTKRAALDCALGEWLTTELQKNRERP